MKRFESLQGLTLPTGKWWLCYKWRNVPICTNDIIWNLKHSIDLRMLSTICTAKIMVFPALGIFSSNTHVPKGLVLGVDTWRRYVHIWKNKTYKDLSVTHPTLIQWWTSWHPTAPALRLRSVRLSPPWPTGEVSTSREPFIDGIRAPIISNTWGSSKKKFEKEVLTVFIFHISLIFDWHIGSEVTFLWHGRNLNPILEGSSSQAALKTLRPPHLHAQSLGFFSCLHDV